MPSSCPLSDRDDGRASGARTFTLLISADSAFKRLVVSRPALLCTFAQWVCLRATPSDLHDHHSLDNGVMAARATASIVDEMIGTGAGLSVQIAAIKVRSIVQLEKADAPLVPEAYIHLLGVQCPVSFSNDLTGYTFPSTTPSQSKKPHVD